MNVKLGTWKRMHNESDSRVILGGRKGGGEGDSSPPPTCMKS